MHFHHIGVACKNIELEIANIKKIHNIQNISNIVFDEEQNASLCLLNINGGVNLELISGKQVDNLIKKGISYYHICYETENIEIVLNDLLKSGAILVSPLKQAKLFNMRRVAFLYLSYGLVELLEK